MKIVNFIILTLIIGCSAKNENGSQKANLTQLFEVDQLINRNTRYVLERYEEMNEFSNSSTINEFTSNQSYFELKESTLHDVEELINEALFDEKTKLDAIRCLEHNKTADELCVQNVQSVMSSIIPYLQNYGLKLDSLVVNLLDRNGELNPMQTSDRCIEIKNGRFQNKIGNDNLIVTRTNDSQTEHFNGTSRKFKITWINECTYQTLEISPNSDTFTNFGNELLTKSAIEVINVTDSYYLYKIYAVRPKSIGLGNLIGIGKLYRN